MLEDLNVQQLQVKGNEAQLHQSTDAAELPISLQSKGKGKAVKGTQQEQDNNVCRDCVTLLDNSNIKDTS